MTAAVLERPVSGRSPAGCSGGRPAGEAPAPGGTLEALLSSALHEARASGSTECPVCHASMTLARAGAREARCGGCGSRLS